MYLFFYYIYEAVPLVPDTLTQTISGAIITSMMLPLPAASSCCWRPLESCMKSCLLDNHYMRLVLLLLERGGGRAGWTISYHYYYTSS